MVSSSGVITVAVMSLFSEYYEANEWYRIKTVLGPSSSSVKIWADLVINKQLLHALFVPAIEDRQVYQKARCKTKRYIQQIWTKTSNKVLTRLQLIRHETLASPNRVSEEHHS